MGSLASRPKALAVQTVYTPVYMPAPISAPQPQAQSQTVSSTEADSSTQTPTVSEGEQASVRRSQNLLERNRGVFGTILTGFRGVLNQSVQSQRKTLLGE